MSEVAQLREQAARARRLASGVGDPALRQTFEEIAQEYEALVAFLRGDPLPNRVATYH